MANAGRGILRLLAAIGTGILVATAFVAWRVGQGPVDLAFLTPIVERGLSRPASGYRVEVDSLRFTWDGAGDDLLIQVVGPRILDPHDETLIDASALEIALSGIALVEGRISPSSIYLVGVGIELVRTRGGDWRFLVGGRESDGRIDLQQWLGGDDGPGFDTITEVGVRGAVAVVVDEASGRRWEVPQIDLGLRRAAGTIRADGSFSLRMGDAVGKAGFEAAFDTGIQSASVSLRFGEVATDRIAGLHPDLSVLRYLRLPLTGALSFEIDTNGDVGAFDIDLAGGGGALRDPGNAGRRVLLDRAEVRVSGEAGLSRVAVREVAVTALGRTARLSGMFSRTDRAVFRGEVRDVLPALFASLAPEFGWLEGIGHPLSGGLEVEFDAGGIPREVRVDLGIEPGTLRLPGLELPAPVRLTGGRLVAGLSGGRIKLDRLDLRLPDGSGRITGEGERTDGGWRIRAKAEGRGIPVDDLRLYWPPDAVPGARTWVADNLSGGIVDSFEVGVGGEFAAAAAPDIRITGMDGTLAFSGVTARYWRPLPPFRDVAGTARFDQGSFLLTLTDGNHGDIRLLPSTVALTGLDGDAQREFADIAANFRGPASGFLGVLDRDPLRYARRMGLDPAAVGGRMTAGLELRLPLLDDLEFRDIAIAAEVEVDDAEVPDFLDVHDFVGGKLEVAIDGERALASGTGMVAGVPVDLEAERFFAESAPHRARYRVAGRLGDADRARFNVGLAPYLTGSLDVVLESTEFRDRPAEHDLDLDLTGALVDLPALSWSKSVGTEGRARGSLRRLSDGSWEVSGIAVRAPGLDVDGTVRLDDTSLAPVRLDFPHLRIGARTDMGLRVTGLTDGGRLIAASGASADLAGFLREATRKGASRDRTAAEEDGSAGERKDGGADEPTVVTLDLGRAWVGGKAPLGRVAGTFRMEGERPVRARVRARTEDGHPVALELTPDDSGGVAGRMTAEDAGGLLRALGWFEDMSGGRLDVRAGREPAGTTYAGKAGIDNFRIRPDSGLAGRLSDASPPVIGALLTGGDELGFERVSGLFTFGPDRIAIRHGRMYGPALGITFRGALDRKRETVAIRGAVAPMNFINRMLRAIPILGDLLVGGDEGGLIAASYTFSGPLDEPEFSVKPLTILTPGILRDLFGPLLGGGSPAAGPDGAPVRSDG